MSQNWMVCFTNVGRGKQSWNETLHQQPTEAIVTTLVKRKRALMSNDVECAFEDDDSGRGTIFAGLYVVGRFCIEPIP